MARLGLYHDVAPLTHRHMDPRRLWRTSQHGSFATNLAFTLSNCTQNRWWVSMATSEHLAALEGCEGPTGCSWEEFTQVLSGSLHCDLDIICAVTPFMTTSEYLRSVPSCISTSQLPLHVHQSSHITFVFTKS
ncbi:hypothetical protein E2C01_052304 [Portunus trituberculatus]|uniref:Uncharacterized protein n=1 Tax=Portunus trituberculatus TaxID=210409 RepID=A0A5B7GLK3_PORTR|nr:hypothetical protein [Portunus trituberculatus]